MTEQQFQQLITLLGNLGNHAYQAALRQVYVDAWINLLVGVVALAVFVICIFGVIRYMKLVNDDISSATFDDAVFIAWVAGLMLSVPIMAVGLSIGVKLLANPEWQAIKYLAGLVK